MWVQSGCDEGDSATDPQTDAAEFTDSGTGSGDCAPASALESVDTSNPDHVVGDGTAESCTATAFREAVAEGGVITFDCGDEPVRITLDEPARIYNDASDEVVIDGGGKVTLSGRGQNRILYMNTCDQNLVWTTPHCQNQDHPRLTLQNLTFVDGHVTGEKPIDGVYGGGAVFVRGGRLKVINCQFFNNTCDETGPDVGGGALRVLSQYDNQPVYVVNSRFGGEGELGNECSNGAALSSIGVSWEVIDSAFENNRAIGIGANPAREGTPGGGSGGAMYFDGNTFDVNVCGTVIEDNHAREGGGAIFFVSNDRTGTLRIEGSRLTNNPSEGFETSGYPGIFVLAAEDPEVVNSTLE
jgi:hypothetical protein